MHTPDHTLRTTTLEPQHQDMAISHSLGLQLIKTKWSMGTFVHKAILKDWASKSFPLIHIIKHKKSYKVRK